MSKLDQLLKQQQDIASAIEEERAKGRDEAVANVKSLIKQYSITLREVKPVLTMRKPRTTKATTAKRAPAKRKTAKR